MKKLKVRPKIKKNKLDKNPLFINFLNWKGDKYAVEKMLENLLEQFEDEEDQKIVEKKLNSLDDSYLNNLTEFNKSFRKYVVEAINSQTVSEEFLFWLNNAYKYLEEKIEKYLNDEDRKIHIKNDEGRWLEALFCHNFIMAFNYFGLDIIKLCPICSSFFSHKGKYARYCSEGCKEIGIKRRKER